MTIIAVFVIVLFTASAANAEPADVVRGLTKAFNQHDVAATGIASIEDGLRGYFRAYADVRSSPSRLIENGLYVTAVETASWSSNGAKRTQSAVVVYENST